MEIHIDRDSGIPIYIQIKRQIKNMIKKDILTKGDRLPPERELAEKLQVSRNRVSTAYKELENEKIISSQQGKGTFVAGHISGVRESSRKDKLLRIIDLAMEEALQLGFSMDDFLTIAYVRAREKEELLSKTKIVFIECNKEQLNTLIRETDVKHDIAKIPVLIDQIKNEAARIKKVIEKAGIVITTSFHLEEVESFITGMDKEIIAMSLEPNMETIIKMARIKEGKKVGLVCQSSNFALEVKNSLANIRLNNFEFDYNLTEGKELENFIAEKDIIITSPHRYKEVNKLTDKKIINFEYAPDRGSINMLKMALLELKET